MLPSAYVMVPRGAAFEGAATSHTITEEKYSPVFEGAGRLVNSTLTGASATVKLSEGQASPLGWTTRTISWLSAWAAGARTEYA